MNHKYYVSGMSCNGCRTHVEAALNKIDGVKHAEVNLETETAVVEMDEFVSTDRLQTALSAAGNYTIGTDVKKKSS